ncbi:hypothetical protein ZIOFF_070105 [Zingiber officinale]|uniref:Uncharacterized protein n=1 Tax=Zingiber officinale TaxID=94328 RepID=A0A8J5CWG5_ZINOF|nr:hypothetical protein ZIOFF_070105 [Zingiber officinale]
MRGISREEKKRLSIALEILMWLWLLFLDEPTTGLDSATAFFVVQTLKHIVVDGNKTIVSSIHHPSNEVFHLLNDLCLLSSGEVIFFGDAKLAIQAVIAEDRLTSASNQVLWAAQDYVPKAITLILGL